MQRRMERIERVSAHAARSMRRMGGAVLGLAAGYLSLRAVADGIRSINRELNIRLNAEARLNTLMGNVKGTTKAQIRDMQRYAGALQNVTTIGDDTTIHGASQLATFQLQAKYIKKLLPSLQDLAVGTYGVNVSQEQMQQSGNLLGKVFTGQVGALKRVGISFDKNQEKLLKEGTQAEKVATLIKVIDKNYGGLARRMRQTPEGAVIALKNAWGDVQEEIGLRVLPHVTKLLNYLGPQIPKVMDMILRSIDRIERLGKRYGPQIIRVWNVLQAAGKTALQWLTKEGKQFFAWFMEAWKKIKPTVISLLPTFKIIGKSLLSIWQSVKPLIGFLITTWWPILVKVLAFVLKIVGVVLTVIAAIIKALSWAIMKVVSIKDKFGEWLTLIKIVAGKLKSEFKAAFDWIVNNPVFKVLSFLINPDGSVAGLIVKAVGNRKGNTSGNKGGTSSTLGVPKPPMVRDRGGMITRPEFSWLAKDGRPELVLPLSDRERTQGLMQRAGLGGDTFIANVTVNGGGNPQETARVTMDAVEQALRQIMRRERRVSYAG
jgi:hypothetical protein